ncbi:SDR family NAD(P)-dependent oxidoreductase [Pseudomonadota bacterium]
MSKKYTNLIKDRFRQLKGRWVVVLHDMCMIPIAWLLAYWLRYNLDEIPNEFLYQAINLIPLVIVIHSLTLIFFGAHRGVWRFISVPDLVRLVKAAIVGTLLLAITIFFLTRLQHVPRSVFILHAIMLVVFLGGPRLFYRLLKDRHIATDNEIRVLIVGAGSAGEQLARDLLRASPRVYAPAAFVDDDRTKYGKEIQGVRVLGNSTTIPFICERWAVELIVIAIPSATAKQMQNVVDWCEKAGAPFRTLPKIQNVLSNQSISSEIRPVEIDDLLGRDQVNLDWSAIDQGLVDKTIVVTGGGGSIGSELCRQLAQLSPHQLIILERSEFNLYSITHELNLKYSDLNLIPCLGDICDRASINYIFEKYKPHIVFHAAAFKHVPLLQEQIRETLRNNVAGTRNVATAAHEHKCESFVLISTDKAVNPTSMMGASKRIAEIFCQALSKESNTQFVTVRFGNVLGSAGSVVPLFRKQIESGGPVTVTHPEITRYFMTMVEATQLILQASVLGKGSEIYVLDMGEPVKISYLAQQLIRLSGKIPDEQIKIEYTGLRPGEKLSEELFHPDESLSDTSHEKIFLANSRTVEWNMVSKTMNQLETCCETFNIDELHRLAALLVPEYSNSQTDVDAGKDDSKLNELASL